MQRHNIASWGLCYYAFSRLVVGQTAAFVPSFFLLVSFVEAMLFLKGTCIIGDQISPLDFFSFVSTYLFSC